MKYPYTSEEYTDSMNCGSELSSYSNYSCTSFCLKSSSCRTDLSTHFQPSRPTTIWMFFSYPYATTLTLQYILLWDRPQKVWNNARWLTLTLGGWHNDVTLLKHFISRTFTLLLSVLLIPHASAPYNSVGKITPSYRHFLAFIPYPLLLRTLFSAPRAL